MDEYTQRTLPAGWSESSIGEITLPVQKVDPLDEPGREIEYIDISSIDNIRNVVGEVKRFRMQEAPSRARQIVSAGDVLFATVRPYLRNIAAVPTKLDGQIASTGFSVLRPARDIEPRFLFYKTTSTDFVNALSVEQYGVSYPAVTEDQVREQLILVPPYKEQCRIVAKIEELFLELDNGLDSLRTAQQQLKVYRHALLKYAFEGRLTARWREQNNEQLESGNKLLARINHEREARYQIACREWREVYSAWEASGQGGRRPPKPIKPTEVVPIDTVDDIKLPGLPYGWLWLRYGDLCALVRNGISKKPDGTQGAKIFRISAVRPMEFDLTDFRYLKNSTGEYDAYYLASGDLIFTRYNGSRAYVGVCAEYKGNGEHLFPDKLIQTRLSSSLTDPSFLEKALNCGASRRFVESKIRTTAGQSGVSGADIKSIPVPVCGVAEQVLIQERLGSKLTKVAYLLDAIENALMRSEALRQSILERAFSGKLVAQNPHDQPALILLERIKAEKAETENGKKKIKRTAAA
jgi:type I restriction enzyme S subunit